MLFYNRNDFTKTLSQQFRMSAKWRKSNAKRYNDDRNLEAAKRLLELESQIVIQDEVWEHLKPLVSGPPSLAAISQTNREVGFKRHPADFTAWLENLHAELTRG